MIAAPAQSLQFEFDGDWLAVRVHGREIVTAKEKGVRAVTDEVVRVHPRGVLIDLREVPGTFTFFDRYELGELAGRYFRGPPIAVLARPAMIDPHRIGLLVALNRGATVAVFEEETAARTWLVARAQSRPPLIPPTI